VLKEKLLRLKAKVKHARGSVASNEKNSRALGDKKGKMSKTSFVAHHLMKFS
jgi:hypothetical protein